MLDRLLRMVYYLHMLSHLDKALILDIRNAGPSGMKAIDMVVGQEVLDRLVRQGVISRVRGSSPCAVTRYRAR